MIRSSADCAHRVYHKTLYIESSAPSFPLHNTINSLDSEFTSYPYASHARLFRCHGVLLRGVGLADGDSQSWGVGWSRERRFNSCVGIHGDLWLVAKAISIASSADHILAAPPASLTLHRMASDAINTTGPLKYRIMEDTIDAFAESV